MLVVMILTEVLSFMFTMIWLENGPSEMRNCGNHIHGLIFMVTFGLSFGEKKTHNVFKSWKISYRNNSIGDEH